MMCDKQITRRHHIVFLCLLTIVGSSASQELLDADQFVALIRKACRVLDTVSGPKPSKPFGLMQATTVKPGTKKGIIGDLHGDVVSLEHDLAGLRAKGFFQSNDPVSPLYNKLKPGHVLFGTGDYSDRGYHSVEVMQRYLRILIANPRSCFLLHGNHDSPQAGNSLRTDELWFKDELIIKYPGANIEVIFDHVKQLWARLPSLLFIGEKDAKAMMVSYMLAVHGAIEPALVGLCNELQRRSTIAATGTIVSLFFFDCDLLIKDEKLGELYIRPPSVDENGLQWSDIQKVGQETTAGRFDRVFSLNMLEYLPQLAGTGGSWKYRTYCVARGHQHYDGGVLVNTHTGFVPLKSGVRRPIALYDVFTFISSPEGLQFIRDDAYGIIQTRGDQWTITPYRRKEQQMCGCSRVYDTNPGLQRLVIDTTFKGFLKLIAHSKQKNMSNAAIFLWHLMQEIPGLNVQKTVNNQFAYAQQFWFKVKRKIEKLPDFWRQRLHRDLDGHFIEMQAKCLLTTLTKKALMLSGDAEIESGAQAIDDALTVNPYKHLEELIQDHEFTGNAFYKFMVGQLSVYSKDDIADRLRRAIPQDLFEGCAKP